jgi:hypothetical protein
MLPFVIAGALVAAQPTACPSDLLVANPSVTVVKAQQHGLYNYVVTVDVKNQGTAAQRKDIAQHLDVLVNNKASGTQPIPGLGANENYAAAFRFQLPRPKHSNVPLVVTFHYVMDSKSLPGENCTTADDTVTKTL